MAKILLEINADTSQATPEITELGNSLNRVSVESKKSNKVISDGLKDIASSADKADKAVQKIGPSDAQKKQISAIQQLKAEIRAYESAAIAAGEGTQEFARNIALAGQKKADLKDLKEAIAALDPDSVAQGFLGLASSIAGGFAVAQSAIALTGEKNEELEKTLIKVQAAQGLLSGLQQLANTQDELGKVKIIALNKLALLQTNLQTAAESKSILVRRAAAVAQTALNAVTSLGSGGVLLLVGGIATLIAGLSRLIPTTESATEKQERLNKELDKSKEITSALISGQDAYIQLLEAQGAEEDKINKARDVAFSLKKQQISEEKKVNQESLEAFKTQLNEQLEEQKDYNNKGLIEDIAATREKIEEIKRRGQVLLIQEQEINVKRLTEDAKTKSELERKEKEANDKLIQLRKEFNQAALDLQKAANIAQAQSLSGTERIEAERKIAQAEIDEREKEFIRKGKLINDNFKLSAEQQKNFGILRASIDKQANDRIIEINQEYYDKAIAGQKEAEQESIEIANKFIDENLKSLEEANRAKILLTEEGTKQRLDAEIKAIETERDFRLQNIQLTEDQIIIIQQESAKKIQELQKDFQQKNKFDIFDFLGLKVSPEEKEKILSSIQSIANSAKQIFEKQLQNEQEALDKRKEINEQQIQLGNTRISELQKQLDLELELNKQGLANNTNEVKNAIAQEIAARDAALEEQKRIAQEQEQIKRRQAAIDAITQVSQLLSAGATLFAQGAFSGPVGIFTSIATIAAMISAFLALKNQVQQISGNGFKDGGYTGDIGTNEVAGVTHGQEFVNTAKTTKKHRKILEAMHNENYSSVGISDLEPFLKGVGISFNQNVLSDISNEGQAYHNSKNDFAREQLAETKSLNKKLSNFYGHIKNRPEQSRNHNGDITIKQGNNTRIIKKR